MVDETPIFVEENKVNGDDPMFAAQQKGNLNRMILVVRLFFLWLFFLTLPSFSNAAQVISANPDNYRSFISSLQPGDTLSLAAGTYTQGLPLSNLHGEAGNPIVITGPESGDLAIFEGSRDQAWNTVQLENVSYITVRNLYLDGLDIPYIDAVNARGITHHITIEGLEIVHHGGHQLTIGISTHGPAWDWVIRNNKIIGAGTGMYLGNWQGNDWPFVGGLIEHNLIQDTIGYNIQIKQMNSRSYQDGTPIPGMSTEDRKTIIRDNVFSKAVQPSIPTEGARPNLLVDHFPLTGPGSNDLYEIYGNFFYQNTTEALFQGEGNIALYNNLLINSSGSAIIIQPHNDLPRKIRVFHNTIVATGTGIKVTGVDTNFDQYIQANAIFAGTPLNTSANVVLQDNITDSFDAAGNYLINPTGSIDPPMLDLYPQTGTLSGAVVDTSHMQSFTDWDVDFNGAPRDGGFHGAYSGEGTNPGWQLALGIKPLTTAESVPPTISKQPESQTVLEGQAVTFAVTAIGSGSLSYQWRRDGVPIADATSTSYNLTTVNTGDNAAIFDCLVSNAFGSVASKAVVLSVTKDTIPPTLDSINATTATTLVVNFSETVTQATAEQVSNYSIDGGVTVIAAMLMNGNRSVQLTVSPLTEGAGYSLAVSNIQDRATASNTIAASSKKNFIYSSTNTSSGGNAGVGAGTQGSSAGAIGPLLLLTLLFVVILPNRYRSHLRNGR